MKELKVTIGVRKERNNAPTIFWSERCPKTRKLLRKMQSFGTKKDAEIAAHLKYLEINTDLPMANRTRVKSIPWDMLRDEFLASKRRRNIEQSSISDIENTLVKFEEVVGKPDSSQLCQGLIDRFIDARLSQKRGKTEKKISPATINKDLRNLKSFIMWAKDVDYIHNRFRIIPLKTTKKAIRRLSNKEVKSLITECVDLELQIGIIIAVYTGLREGDIWALKRNQVDTANNCLRNVIERKGRKVTEIVRMAPVAMLRLKQYIEDTIGQSTDGLFKKPFPRDEWDKLRAVAGNCQFHDLRRTCGSMLGGVAGSGWVATKQLGHTDPKVTNEHYMNVDRELIEAHAKMPTADWGLTG